MISDYKNFLNVTTNTQINKELLIKKWIQDKFGGTSPNEFFISLSEGNYYTAIGRYKPLTNMLYMYYLDIKAKLFSFNKLVFFNYKNNQTARAQFKFAVYLPDDVYYFKGLNQFYLSDIININFVSAGIGFVIINLPQSIVLNNVKNGIWFCLQFYNVAGNFRLTNHNYKYPFGINTIRKITGSNNNPYTPMPLLINTNVNDINFPATLVDLDVNGNVNSMTYPNNHLSFMINCDNINLFD